MPPSHRSARGQRPLNVLMLAERLRDTGGAERLVTALATELPRDRCRVTVCTMRASGGRLTRTLDDAGVRHVCLHRRGGFDVLAFRRLVSLLGDEDIDVVHAHNLSANAWGAMAARLARTPVMVAHEHGSGDRALTLRLASRTVARFADAFVVGSTDDRRRLIEADRVPPDKVVLIRGAYIPRPESHDGDVRAELGIPHGAPLIGTIAVLRPEKALDVLIEAFSRLSSSLPNARLLMCGRGPCRTELGRLADELGVAERVLLPGYRNDVPEVLAAVDVAAISSEREGTSLFALECMAHRTPLVSSDVGGPRDMLEDGVSALLVPPRDAGALADALESLLCDPDRAARLAAVAHERLQDLTIDRVAARFADLYEHLLAGAERSSAGVSHLGRG
jgi:glycosyltransferase involved in cell wall biosynthesis